VTPGSVLSPDNRRKVVVWYLSFIEFGYKLSFEEMWLSVAIARTPRIYNHIDSDSKGRAVTTARSCDSYLNLLHIIACTTSMQRTAWIKTVDGGVSRLTRDLLRDIFVTDRAETDGFPLQLVKDGPHTVVRFRLSMIVGDEESLNQMFHTKGASGIAPCALLCCVTNKQVSSDRDRGISSLSDQDPLIPDISCSQLSECGLKSDADVWKTCDDLNNCPRANLAELEHITGFKLLRSTLLFCPLLRPFLRPARIIFNDAMHVIFSNGILGYEMSLCLHEMKRNVSVYFQDIRAFMAEKSFKPALSLFSEVREKSCNETLKGGASEFLLGYVMFRAFIIEVFGARPTEPYIQSILLLCEICDHIRSLLHWPSPSQVRSHAASLRSLVAKHLQAFTALYGRDALKFKHHQLLHLPEMLLMHGVMVACWVLERKHILAKQSIQNCKNLLGVEKTGLSRMLNSQLQSLQAPGWATVLIPPMNDFPEMAPGMSAHSVQISSRMQLRGLELSNRDVIFMDAGRTYVSVIVGCLRFDATDGDISYGLLVKVCNCSTRGQFASTWEVEPAVSVYRLRDEYIFKPAFWRYMNSDRLELLH
jgi:hypothetical protein